MRKLFEWLDNRRFPGDWAVADIIKQYLRGRRKQITKQDKLTKEAEVKERRRRQAYLQKRTVLAEDDPESLAIEATDEALKDEEKDSNWPPARPHKKRHISPVSDLDSGSDSGRSADKNTIQDSDEDHPN
jgi:hypothetical protein